MSDDSSWRQARVGKLLVWHAANISPATFADFVARHRAALQKQAALQKRTSPNTQIVKTTPHRSMSLLQGEAGEVFIKHFHPTEVYKKLTQRWRGKSNARVIAEIGIEFARRGIAIPSILGVVEDAGSRGESFLITGSVAHLSSVEDLLREASTLPLARERRARKNRILQAFAREWQRLHAAGIGYAESHTRHVFLDADPDEAARLLEGAPRAWNFIWIDYDGTQFFEGRVPRETVVNHFFHLARDYRKGRKNCRGVLGRGDLLRFLYFYLDVSPTAQRREKNDVLQLAREVLNWQPDLYWRVMKPTREAFRYLTRKKEREVKNARRRRKKQMLKARRAGQ